MQYMEATQIQRKTETRADGIKLEMVIWQLSQATAERPHGLKYRLWAGRDGNSLVRYDNERGKGDHRHLGRRKISYELRGLAALVEDFMNDVEALK